MISLTNYDFQWARNELVIIYPEIFIRWGQGQSFCSKNISFTLTLCETEHWWQYQNVRLKYVKNLWSLDWFQGESTGNHGFYHQIDRAFRLKFSHHPILWYGWNKIQYLLQVTGGFKKKTLRQSNPAMENVSAILLNRFTTAKKGVHKQKNWGEDGSG